jgi:hypothetical protein
MRQSVQAALRAAAAVGVCGVAFGLAGCGAGEGEGDAAEAAAAEETATEETAAEEGASAEAGEEGGDDDEGSAIGACDLETDAEPSDPRLESVVGEWTAVDESFLGDSEGQGSLLCIDGDGDVYYSSVDGDWAGVLILGEVADHDVVLESVDDETVTEWVFRYEAEEDVIEVGTADEGGPAYARAG